MYIDVGRDNSVDIATRYGVDDARVESRSGAETSRSHPDRPWGPHNLLYNGYRVFPGVKRPRRDVAHPPLLAPRLKKEYR